MFLEFFAIGLVSLLGQIVLLRELSVATYGVELIYLLGMACWLIGSGLGAGLGRKRGWVGYSSILWLFLGYSILLSVNVLFLRASRWLLGGVTGAFLPFHLQILTLLVSVIPLAFLMGMAFQRAARFWIAESKAKNALARAYGWECMGSVVAGGIATLAPAFHIPNLAMGLFCAAFPLVMLPFRKSRLKVRMQVVTACLLVLFFAFFVFLKPLDLWSSAFNHPFLKTVTDTPYGRIAITSLEGQTTVFENDAVSFETESTFAEELVHTAALQHTSPQCVLLLGGGLEGLVEEVLKYSSVSSVDYVELNQGLIAVTLPFLTEDRKNALKNAKVQVINEDPRRFLSQTSQKYDLILVAMPEPSSGQANRFYTREFFELCRARLGTNGVLGFRLSASENFWSQHLIARNRAIVSALSQVFAHVLVLPGSINLVIAGNELTTNTDILARRYEALGIANRLVIPQYLEYLLRGDRFQEVAGHMSAQNGTDLINTDKRPVCYSLTITLWLSKFFPSILAAERPLDLNGPASFTGFLWSILLVICLLFFFMRRTDVLLKTGVMAWAAFWSAVMETLLLLQYQVSSGALYGELGLLLMVFMIGMSLGAMVFEAISAARFVGIVLVLCMASVSIFVALGIQHGVLHGFHWIGLGMWLCGFLLAGTFSYLSHDRSQERLVSPLYAADLVGGAVGTLCAALYAVPFWGLPQTALSIGIWSFGVVFGM
ncbi:MAG: hypothetical protein ABWK15_07370 [Dissulfuribacterales bacterium]